MIKNHQLTPGGRLYSWIVLLPLIFTCILCACTQSSPNTLTTEDAIPSPTADSHLPSTMAISTPTPQPIVTVTTSAITAQSPYPTDASSRIDITVWAKLIIPYHQAYAAWSPEGQDFVLSSFGFPANPSISRYNAATLMEIWQINEWARPLVFSPDGKIIFAIGEERMLLDATTGQLIESIQNWSVEQFAVFLPDGSTILEGQTMLQRDETAHTSIIKWDRQLKRNELIASFDGYLRSLDISPSGDMLATGFSRIWDVEGGQQIFLWDYPTMEKRCAFPGREARFSPAGGIIGTVDEEGRIRLFNAVSCDLVKTIGETNSTTTFDFSSNGKLLAYSLESYRRIDLVDIASGETISQMTGLGSSIELIDFSPDGDFLLSISSTTPGSDGHIQQVLQIWKIIDPTSK